jgi:hypothetical protein
VADLELQRNGTSSHGRLVVERDGRVFVESVPASHRVWAAQHLGCIVRQRLAKDDVRNATWMFVKLWDERPRLGYAVRRTDAPFGPCHWIENQRLQAREVRSAKRRERLTTLKTERNADNKLLPTVQVLHRWKAQTLELESTETTLLFWQRVDTFDLPATIEVLAASAGDKPVSGRIVLTRHRLLSCPDALFAGR